METENRIDDWTELRETILNGVLDSLMMTQGGLERSSSPMHSVESMEGIG